MYVLEGITNYFSIIFDSNASKFIKYNDLLHKLKEKKSTF